MYTMQEKLKFKEDILKCIHVCGGVTGKYIKLLCPDEEFIFELMKAEKIRRIPIEVVKSDKTRHKMYLFEAVSKLKPAKFPNMSEEDARKIALVNKCYISYRDVMWLGQEDIKTFTSGSGLKDKLIPSMMFYKDSELNAVYILRKNSNLNENDKIDIANKLNADNVIEYLF